MSNELKPFANSLPLAGSLLPTFLLEIQAGSQLDENGLNQMRYITIAKLQEYMKSASLGSFVNRGAYASGLPSNAAVNDMFYAAATFTVDEVTYNAGRLYAYSTESRWDDVTNILAQYALATDVQSALNEKVNISDIVDSLESTRTNAPLSAYQGKVLKDAVDLKVSISEIVDDLETADPDVPLAAKQGKVLKDLLDALALLIPPQASEINQLADKEFTNSSIATNTAHYISDQGEPFTSVASLEAYSGIVTHNDYAFVTGTDAEGNTYYDRYKASVVGNVVTWGKEYRLNNSSFTAAQWAAIQSGITAVLVASYNAHLADSTIHVTASDKINWNAKQNALEYDLRPTQNSEKMLKSGAIFDAINSISSGLRGIGVFSKIDRWLRFSASNHKALIIKGGTLLKLSDGNVLNVATDTTYDLSSYISSVGTDYAVYLDNNGDMSAYPVAAAAPADTIKIGRFHTLCANVGSISAIFPGSAVNGYFMVKPYREDEDPDFYAFYHKAATSSGGVVTCDHPLSGYLAGEIIPESVFCLTFHPSALYDDAMAYDKATDKAIDIYLQSGTGIETRSAYGATHTVSRRPICHQEDMLAVGKSLLTDVEFENASLGSNQATNITGSSDKTTVGGHVDTSNRRMISAIGCEEMCGYLWQWLNEIGFNGQTGWNGYGDTGAFGQTYGMPYVLLAGGDWGNGSDCGSRSRSCVDSRVHVLTNGGGRGASHIVRSV